MQHNETPYSSNAKSGEKVDVIFLIGPDADGQDGFQKHAASIRQYCEDNNILYAMLGDGTTSISISALEQLPKSDVLITRAHGDTSANQKGLRTHHLDLFNDSNKDSIEILSQVQESCGSQKILCCSCYSGKLNHDLSSGFVNSPFKPGTEIIASSNPDEPSFQFNSINMINDALVSIRNYTSFSDLYSYMLTRTPDTISYGLQNGEDFNNFVVRREDRVDIGSNDILRWINFNLERFSDFQKENHLSPAKLDDISQDDLEKFRSLSLLYNALRFDHDVINFLSQHVFDFDKTIIENNATELTLGMLKHKKLNLAVQDEKIINTLTILVDTDPEGMKKYFDHEFKQMSEPDKIHIRDVLCAVAENAKDSKITNILIDEFGTQSLLSQSLVENQSYLTNHILSNHTYELQKTVTQLTDIEKYFAAECKKNGINAHDAKQLMQLEVNYDRITKEYNKLTIYGYNYDNYHIIKPAQDAQLACKKELKALRDKVNMPEFMAPIAKQYQETWLKADLSKRALDTRPTLSELNNGLAQLLMSSSQDAKDAVQHYLQANKIYDALKIRRNCDPPEPVPNDVFKGKLNAVAYARSALIKVLGDSDNDKAIMKMLTQICELTYSGMKVEKQRRADEANQNHTNQPPQTLVASDKTIQHESEDKPQEPQIRGLKF